MEDKKFEFLYEKAKEIMKLLLLDEHYTPIDIVMFCDTILSETATMVKVVDNITGDNKYNVFINLVAIIPDFVKNFVNKTENNATCEVAKNAIDKLFKKEKKDD